MLKHTVLMKVREGVAQYEVDTVFSYVHDLKNALPGILSFTYGKTANLNGNDGDYTHGFSMVFVDEDYYQDYLKHPKFLESQHRLQHVLASPESMVMFNYLF